MLQFPYFFQSFSFLLHISSYGKKIKNKKLYISAKPFAISELEANYFEALWQVADVQQQGSLAGNVAVQFFMNSGVQGPVLREVTTRNYSKSCYF